MELLRKLNVQLSPAVSSGLLLAVRLIAGVGLATHGWGKIQSPFDWMGPDATIPGVFQALAALSEFGGGLAWILGLLTPLASFGVLCTMAVAVYTHAVMRGDPFVGQGGPAYELAAMYLCIALVMLAVGPGKFSADEILTKK